jgi:hypothetical protein
MDIRRKIVNLFEKDDWDEKCKKLLLGVACELGVKIWFSEKKNKIIEKLKSFQIEIATFKLQPLTFLPNLQPQMSMEIGNNFHHHWEIHQEKRQIPSNKSEIDKFIIIISMQHGINLLLAQALWKIFISSWAEKKLISPSSFMNRKSIREGRIYVKGNHWRIFVCTG